MLEDYLSAIRLWRSQLRIAPDRKLVRLLGEAHFRYALSLDRTHKLPRVISELHQAIQRVPDMAIYHYHLGLAYHLKGDSSRAVAAYRKAVELAPENERFRRHLELALAGMDRGTGEEPLSIWQWMREGRYAEALDRLDQEPEQEMTLLISGVLAAVQGDYVSAKRALNRCERTEYASIAAHYLGNIYAEEGKLPSAIKFLEKAIRDPELAEKDTLLLIAVYTQQARRYMEKGDETKAGRLWSKLARLDPHNPAATNAVAVVLEEGARHAANGDFASAMRTWRRVINQGVEHPVLLQNYAIACDRNGRYFDALSAWRKLAEIWEAVLPASTGDSVAHKKVGLVYRRIGEIATHFGDFHMVEDAYRKALRYLPEDIDIGLRLCVLKTEVGDLRSAISELKRLERQHPENLRLLQTAISIYLMGDMYDQALDAAIQILKLDPTQEPARELLRDLGYYEAQTLSDRRSTRRALRLLNKLITVDPEFLPYSHLKMRLLFSDGKLKEARQILERLLESAEETSADAALAHAQFGFLCMRQKLYAEAEDHFRTAGGIECPSAAGLLLIAAAHLKHDEVVSDRYFEAFVEHPEASPELLAETVHRWTDVKRGDLGTRLLERGLELYPNSIELAYTLVMHCFIGEGSDTSEETFNRVLPLLERSRDPAVQELLETLQMMHMLGQAFGTDIREFVEGMFLDEFDEDDEPF